MAVTAEGATRVERAPGASRWDRLRWALAAVRVLLVVTAAAVGERSASLADLEAALADGRVGTVQVTPGLEAGAVGYATQEVAWRDGPFRRFTEVVQVAPGQGTVSYGGELPVVARDLGAELAQEHPGLRVERAEPLGSWSTVFGWRAPTALGPVAIAGGLAGLALLVGGPQPWRATRWAWFWVACVPLGGLALLLLSGPTPPLPAPRDPHRRLTGGWAFLLVVLVLGPLLRPLRG